MIYIYSDYFWLQIELICIVRRAPPKTRARKTPSRLLDDFDMCPDVKDDRPGVELGYSSISAVCEIRVLMGKLDRPVHGRAKQTVVSKNIRTVGRVLN